MLYDHDQYNVKNYLTLSKNIYKKKNKKHD